MNPRVYAVVITRRAQKELARIPAPERMPIVAALRGLEVNPRPPGWLSPRFDTAGKFMLPLAAVA